MDRLADTTMFTIATAGFVPFVRNLHASLDRLGMGDQLEVVALDDDAYRLLSPHMRCRRRAGDGLPAWSDFRSPQYGRTMAFKYAVALDVLRDGRTAWYIDADIVFLKDPTVHLRALMTGADADILIQREAPKNVFNGGFWLARPTPVLIDVFEQTLTALKDPALLEDQNFLNRRLRRTDGLSVLGLDPDLFACANRFDSGGKYGAFDVGAAYLLHFNYMVGKQRKAEAMARHGVAFDPELRALAARARPHTVFAVTSQGRDLFTAMTRIAVASLRITNPAVHVTVACDRETEVALQHSRDPILDEVDTCIALETPPGGPVFRNRFVRTRLRDVLEGPYLYLDSDVLVRGDLAELFALDVDVAAAANHSRTVRAEQISREDAETLRVMGWASLPEIYLNAGVMFLNDTPSARRFCAEWHQRWLASSAGGARPADQPAMNAALAAVQPQMSILSPQFNAQFRNRVDVVRDAAIWHYYASVRHVPATRFELLARDVAGGAALHRRHVVRLVRSPHPWRRATPIDDWAAARILARGRFNGWEAHWLNREFTAAVGRRCARVMKGLGRRAPL